MFIEASSLSEAVKIAEAGREEGQWDLFRGQSNAAWRVTSSAERLNSDGRKTAFEKMERFYRWANNLEAMSIYSQNTDWLWAIAQHYGIPTNFIDFSESPKIAAFFASDHNDQPPPADQQAALICVDTKDFEEFWEKNSSYLFENLQKTKHPKFLQLDVHNLWRLQQQQGKFLWNPIIDIEKIYDFDRIVFPFTKRDPLLPEKTEIYPINRSELEKLLTQFFMEEQLREGGAAISSFGNLVYQIEASVESYEASSWNIDGIITTDDWKDTYAWDAKYIEHATTALPGINIDLKSAKSVDEIISMIKNEISLSFIANNRDRVLNFQISLDHASSRLESRLISCFRTLWNGMRILPYSHSEIHIALDATAQLFQIAEQSRDGQKPLGPNSLYIDMASSSEGFGAYSRGTITSEAFLEASNPNFIAAAQSLWAKSNKKYQDPKALSTALLMLAGRPWERLSFSGCRKLLAEQLIPTQIAWRVSHDENNINTVIYFSPKDFKVFGLA